MNRADLTTLAASYAITPFDADAFDRYLEDTLEECARYTIPPHVNLALQSVTAGTSEYTPEARAIKILAAFFGSKQLSLTDIPDLEAYNDDWRNDTDTPWAISFDEQSGSDYFLYPEPNVTSNAFIPLTDADPFGRDYPANNTALLYGDKRDMDIHDYTALSIVLKALSKEFTRPSSHRDKTFSDGCGLLADLIFSLIGVTL